MDRTTLTPDSGVAARLFLLVAAALFSTGGTVVKIVSLGGLEVACLRSGIAAVGLWLLVPATRRLPRRPRAWAVAGSFAATLLLFVLSSRATTVANAAFLQATAPLYVLVFGPLLLRERFQGRDLWTLLGIGAGLVLLLSAQVEPGATSPDPVRGNLLAAGAGATWGLTVLGLRWLARGGESTLPVVALGNALVFLVCLPFTDELVPASATDAGGLMWLGLVQIALAYAFLTRGLRGVPAFQASLLVQVEPVLAPLWAFLWHREVPGSGTLVGGALVLACAVDIALRARREGPQSSSSSPPR